MEKLYFDLLKDFCDALLSLQLRGTGDPTLDGAFHCRACHVLHGRNADAVYPLVVMAKRTGERNYLEAAKAVFTWGENLVCDDGAVLNDAQNDWKGITVFAATALCEALNCGGELLDSETKKAWEARLLGMGEWLYHNLDENYHANINYPASNTVALALLGKYFGRTDYLRQAKHLADYAMERITENGFLWGESQPRDGISPLGCRAVDMGYNLEESFPSLVKYAYTVDDEAMLATLTDVLRRQLAFMLPDGAWDNSFGTRNNKWTYWGSRTSDGCAAAFTLLARRDPIFAEAARRNTELVKACTHGGLLFGGPHYHRHGEYPCTHHTFEHANAIAFALEHSEGMSLLELPLPADEPAPLVYYPEINVYQLAMGDYRATVTGYDFAVKAGCQVTGGTLSLLWKYGPGPMVAASVMDYTLVEHHNMQLTRATSSHRPLVPRLECQEGKTVYTTAYFTTPKMTASQGENAVTVIATSGLADKNLHRMENDCDRVLTYTLTREGLRIAVAHAKGTRLVLPVIAGTLNILRGSVQGCEDIFFLTGGFEAKEYVIAPDGDGNIDLILA